MITGIIVALPEELSTLTTQKIAPGSSAFIAAGCIAALSGAGPDNARKAAQELVAKGAKRLLSWGCAGALDATLKPGTVCLPDVLQNVSGMEFGTDPRWREQICAALLEEKTRVASGKLLESTRIVAASADKLRLGTKHRAQLVDMESCACADVAKQANIPFVAIRSIADPASLDLPRAVTVAMQADGQVALGKILWHLLEHPSEIVALIKLGIHFQAAKKALRSVRGKLPVLLEAQLAAGA